MKFTNVRLGLATNSSSSHSLLLVSNPQHYQNQKQETRQFDWEQWLAATPEAKTAWLYQCLKQNLSREIGPTNAVLVANALLYQAVNNNLDPDDEGYVDHQSELLLPRKTTDPKTVDAEFLNALLQNLLRPELVLQGGNDNEELPDIVAGTPVTWWHKIPKDERYQLLAKHIGAQQWVLFNIQTGARILLDFNDGTDGELRPPTPLLVDWKITNHCTAGCQFCYQDSTPTGTAITRGQMYDQIDLIKSWQPFEVTLGGGEPTTYQHFSEIVNYLDFSNIAVSATTRNYAWLSTAKKCNLRAIGVSVAAYSEELATILLGFQNRNPTTTIVLHIVDGVVAPEAITAWWRWCNKHCDYSSYGNLLFLGYKTCGRATDYKPPYLGAWRTLSELCYGLRVDSLFATQYKKDLQDYEPLTVDTREGWYSCYIDGPAALLAPSSYQMEQALPLTANAWSKLTVN